MSALLPSVSAAAKPVARATAPRARVVVLEEVEEAREDDDRDEEEEAVRGPAVRAAAAQPALFGGPRPPRQPRPKPPLPARALPIDDTPAGSCSEHGSHRKPPVLTVEDMLEMCGLGTSTPAAPAVSSSASARVEVNPPGLSTTECRHGTMGDTGHGTTAPGDGPLTADNMLAICGMDGSAPQALKIC